MVLAGFLWLLICGGGAAVVRRVPLSGARSPRGWVAGSRLRFVFCVIGFAGFLCGFRFRSFAFVLPKKCSFRSVLGAGAG